MDVVPARTHTIASENYGYSPGEVVQINYEKGNAWWWFWIACALPFWLYTASVLFFVISILPSGRLYDTSGSLVLGLVPAAIALCFTRMGLNRSRLTITLSPKGLYFPKPLQGSLLQRTDREWSDIHSIDFSGVVTPASVLNWTPLLGYAITIDFKSGGSLLIGLDSVKRSGVEQLFEAIERWSDISVLSQRAAIFHRYLVCVDEKVPPSLTAIWTDALESQFATTNFVPLKSGTMLMSQRYRVRMQLACGGLCAVYLAEQVPGVKVILKESVLPLDTTDQTRIKARQLFEREAALLSKLNHPRIAKVLDFFVEEGRDYIVLEYVPGINLRQMIQAGATRDQRFLKSCAGQIAQIVEYLHGLTPPVVHRDLTPDNLIIDDDGKLTLIDFGASNEFVGQATGTMIGKQAYIPPEQFKGKASPASDIYAFGATMYFLATGQDPVPLSASQCPEIGAQIDCLIQACTQLEPDSRPDASHLVDQCRQLP